MKRKKFGTFKGVFIPSTEAILGTVLFLLLPALTADAGFIVMAAIVLASHTVSLSTAFSLSDVATNLHKIGGGGMYALSKKSLGRALGGAIGIQLYIAQAASISFYCMGFAEPLQPFMQSFFENGIFQEYAHDVLKQKQIIATSCYFIFFTIVMIGADFTLKIQSLIFVILIGSVIAIFSAPFLSIEYEGIAVLADSINLDGNRPMTLALVLVIFTQFFPAVTGLDAGVGMSGDLQNPQRSLVRGTFYSIAFTFVIYMAATLVFSLLQKDLLVIAYEGGSPVGALLTDVLGLANGFPKNIPALIVFTGILFATSSSALSVFMTAPRTLQSLAGDRILPKKLTFLKNDFKHEGSEPRFAALPTFIISLLLIWSGSIGAIAIIVGICFLIVYGWINGAALLERLSLNPSFRPTSKNHWSISLYGFLACLIAILLYDWVIGLVILIAQYTIFRLILKYKTSGRVEGVWWGVLFTFLMKGYRSLDKVVQGSKNFRPIVAAFAFSGERNNAQQISYLGQVLAAHKGLVHLNILAKESEKLQPILKTISIPAEVVETRDLNAAVQTLIQSCHPAGIQPNTVLMEYTTDLDSASVVKKMLAQKLHIMILKNAEKFEKHDSIDIWWGSEHNGNLMLLLVFMINYSSGNEKGKNRVRILHNLQESDIKDVMQEKLDNYLNDARINADVLIVEDKDSTRYDLIKEYSGQTDLVLVGLPGKYIEKDDVAFFQFILDEYFFDRDMEKYDDLPPILFVRSAFTVKLIEE